MGHDQRGFESGGPSALDRREKLTCDSDAHSLCFARKLSSLAAQPTRNMRTLIYWIYKGFTKHVYIGSFLYAILVLHTLLKKPVRWKSIRLTSLDRRESVPLEVFVNALKLIEEADPRRFKRVTGHLKWIVIGDRKRLGSYSSVGRVCNLRLLSGFQSTERRLIAHLYASVIIHEATHGLLEAKRFAYTRCNASRIERICRAEHWRFLARFPELRHSIQRFLLVKKP